MKNASLFHGFFSGEEDQYNRGERKVLLEVTNLSFKDGVRDPGIFLNMEVKIKKARANKIYKRL